jgi:hypothetical protein
MSVRSRILGAAAAVSLLATAADAQTYTTFNVKGAPTTVAGINDAGDVTGSFNTGHGDHFAVRGYVRSATGKLTRFFIAKSTLPTAINNAGTVAGYYAEAGHSNVGFIRKSNGKIVQFDADSSDVTTPVAINPSGESLALLWDGSAKGAVRTPGGALTKFQMPKAGGDRPSTMPAGLNADGEAVGLEIDLNAQNSRGFVRMPDGTLTLFDVPGAGSGNGQGTFPTGVNSSGTIAGWYMDSSNVGRSFVQTAGGTATSFDVSGASGTVAVAINDDGTMVGRYFGADNVNHGFVRSAAGIITTFDVPASPQTVPTGINSSGQIAGYFYDVSDHTTQGFIRTP